MTNNPLTFAEARKQVINTIKAAGIKLSHVASTDVDKAAKDLMAQDKARRAAASEVDK